MNNNNHNNDNINNLNNRINNKMNENNKLTAEEVKQLLIGVYTRYRKGIITDKQSKQETEILANILKSIEITDIQKQYNEIKAILRSNSQIKS
ncbi:MAG: hypothetical protein PHY80_05600 [Rickettsiales bacterium]|nr:hypothetical protein [Rickettsiales bacterium]